jgi:hypothetical protein
MYNIKIKDIKRIENYVSKIRPLSIQNGWSLNTSTSGDRIIITQFNNCSADTSNENFIYNKDSNGNCTGISLKCGYKYVVTLVCNNYFYVSNDQYGSTNEWFQTPVPDIYIYFAWDYNGNANAESDNNSKTCPGSNINPCTLSKTLTIENFSCDPNTGLNSTLHFKLTNNYKPAKGDSCYFSGYFTIDQYPIS